MEELNQLDPEREGGIARELTKSYEEVLRGRVAELLVEVRERGGLKGEMVLVVAGVS